MKLSCNPSSRRILFSLHLLAQPYKAQLYTQKSHLYQTLSSNSKTGTCFRVGNFTIGATSNSSPTLSYF